MSGIILELKQDVLNEDIDVSNLLRKLLIVAKKSAIVNFKKWIKQELNGYKDKDKDTIPEYRKVKGSIKAFNPYNGYIPVHIQNVKLAEQLSSREIIESISKIMAYSKSKSGYLGLPYSEKIKNDLMNHMKDVKSEPRLHVSVESFVGIIDAVRNKVLDITLQLEKEGITGDGISFSIAEKQKSANSTYNYTTNITNMNNSQLQQNSAESTQNYRADFNIDDVADFIKKVKAVINDCDLSKEKSIEINEKISKIEQEINSGKFETTRIDKCLKTMKNILEGVATNAATTYIMSLLLKFI